VETRSGDQFISPTRGQDEVVASPEAGVCELHWCCRETGQRGVGAEDHDGKDVLS
jgi:hypothetical protein